jgi:hypothetical protein
MSLRLIAHHFAERGQHLPPVDESLWHDYVVGSNGTFARGRRPGLEVCLPVAIYSVRGLKPVFPYVQWGYPKLPARFLERMLNVSRVRCKDGPLEALFHLSFSDKLECYDGSKILDYHRGWHLEYPEQRATADSVQLVHGGRGTSEERAVIELHSHNYDKAYFSPKDDADAGGCSFRVNAVIGTIFDCPAIRVRVALFGYFFEYPASEFFDLPDGLTDCVQWESIYAGT